MTNDAGPVGPDKIMQLGLGFWGSKTLLSAVELGVFSGDAHQRENRQEVQSRLIL